MHWTDRSLFALAVVCYGVSTLHAVFLRRSGFRRDEWITYLLLLAGALLHTLAMLQRGFSLNRCPITNLYEATMFVGWTLVAAYLVIGLWPRLRFVGAFASPLLLGIGVFALMPALDAPAGQTGFAGGWSSLHKALILLAYGTFGLGSAAALMYLSQAYDLKHEKLRAVFSRLPSIQRLEVITRRALQAGWAMLTAGLVCGVGYLKQRRGVYFMADPSVLYSFAVWLLYLGVLVAHGRFAQRGRRFAWSVVGIFLVLMLTFWGFYLLSDLHNPPRQEPAPQAGFQRAPAQGAMRPGVALVSVGALGGAAWADQP